MNNKWTTTKYLILKRNHNNCAHISSSATTRNGQAGNKRATQCATTWQNHIINEPKKSRTNSTKHTIITILFIVLYRLIHFQYCTLSNISHHIIPAQIHIPCAQWTLGYRICIHNGRHWHNNKLLYFWNEQRSLYMHNAQWTKIATNKRINKKIHQNNSESTSKKNQSHKRRTNEPTTNKYSCWLYFKMFCLYGVWCMIRYGMFPLNEYDRFNLQLLKHLSV